MSCADRPRKERMKLVPVYDEDGQYICSEKVSKLEFLVRNIVDEVLGKDRVEPYGKTFNKLEEFIEKAKTEAKIEVLEEVLLKSSRYDASRSIRGDLSKLKKGTKDKGNYPVKCEAEFVEGGLSNFKKKKK